MNHSLIRALNKAKLLPYLNVNGNIVLNQKKFRIPILQKIGFSNMYMSEPWMIELLKIVLPIDDRGFVDVGVNIGQTLLKLRSVSRDIQYVGFEPNAKCVNYVDRLVEENSFTNVSVIPVGISNTTEIGVLNFYYTSKTDSSASMITDFRPEQKVERKEYIPVFDFATLEKVVNFESVSVLKIDVEGAELEVLNGLYPLIQKEQPIILIEILPAYNTENTFRIERQDNIQALLQKADYTMFRVIKEDETLKGLAEISEIGIHSDLNQCEYVMVPKNKKQKFEEAYQERLS
ncbi:MAG: FkbM family methyltransferase [Bacteroidota bacterium]